MNGASLQTIALPAVFDLDALDAVRERLVDALDEGPVRLVGTAVERVSTNSLIMLLSAAATARRAGLRIELHAASEPMQAAIDRLGLSPHFLDLTTA